MYSRCWRKTCNKFMQTSTFNMQEDDPQINVINVPDHDHRPDIDVIVASALTERMKASIVDDPTKPAKRVYDEIVIAFRGDDEHVPAFHTMRSQLNRQRASLCPPILHGGRKNTGLLIE